MTKKKHFENCGRTEGRKDGRTDATPWHKLIGSFGPDELKIKKWVFSMDLNWWNVLGRLFHNFGAIFSKALSPNVLDFTHISERFFFLLWMKISSVTRLISRGISMKAFKNKSEIFYWYYSVSWTEIMQQTADIKLYFQNYCLLAVTIIFKFI